MKVKLVFCIISLAISPFLYSSMGNYGQKESCVLYKGLQLNKITEQSMKRKLGYFFKNHKWVDRNFNEQFFRIPSMKYVDFFSDSEHIKLINETDNVVISYSKESNITSEILKYDNGIWMFEDYHFSTDITTSCHSTARKSTVILLRKYLQTIFEKGEMDYSYISEEEIALFQTSGDKLIYVVYRHDIADNEISSLRILKIIESNK